MSATHVRAWREFFRKAASGQAGYTVTWEDYVILYRAQLGRCFICQTARGINPDDPKARGSQRLGWDHNHATGAVRGLLCTKGEWSCNRIVGRFRDKPEAFWRAFRYLTSPPALVLADVQRALDSHATVGVPMTLDQRKALATALLDVASVRPEPRRGYSASHVIMDELYRYE
jgi:hypothetical protein